MLPRKTTQAGSAAASTLAFRDELGVVRLAPLPVLLHVDIVKAGLVPGELHQHRLVTVDAGLRAQVRHGSPAQGSGSLPGRGYVAISHLCSQHPTYPTWNRAREKKSAPTYPTL